MLGLFQLLYFSIDPVSNAEVAVLLSSCGLSLRVVYVAKAS